MNDNITLNILLSPFALKLRSLRLQKKLSYKDLSAACSISVEKLILYETDKEIPSDSIKKDLLDYLEE